MTNKNYSDQEPKEEKEEESLIMGLFLNFLMNEAIANPETLIPYTEEMSAEVDNLLAN